MHIRYLILLGALLGFAPADAQFVSIQGGAAIPSGSFANSVLSNTEDGFATRGSTFGLFANYLFTKKLGLCVDIRYASLGFDEQSLSDQSASKASPQTQVTASSQNQYSASSAMGGLSYTLGKSNLTFDIRVMTGFLSLTTPSITYTTQYNGQPYNSVYDSQSDLSLAFGYGIGIKYELPKNWFVLLNIDNAYANMEFPENGFQSSNNATVSKPYQVYFLSAGVGYKIQ